ncbi:Lipase 4 [Hanseniaspora vineae]
MKSGAWFDNKYLIETMISFLGDITFREAYNKTGKILNITVSPASIYEQPRLLNCNNSPNILIWSAVCSSCSLPGVFQSTPLYEKDPITGETRIWNAKNSTKFMDGSVDNDLPISRLSEMFNVDHIIACQVNIHIFPLLKLSVSCVGGEIEDEWSAKFKYKLNKISKYVVDEVIHLLDLTIELGITPNLLTKFKSVFLQQYSGDITILPDMDILKLLPKMLSNPTRKFLVTQTVNGLHSTWPKISMIKNHCTQEFALDSAILYLKSELITNNEAFLKSFEHPLHNTLNEVLLEKQGYTENNDEILVQSKKFIPRRRDNSLPSGSFRNSPSKPMSLTHRKMSLSK